jgi:hypothetical protein
VSVVHKGWELVLWLLSEGELNLWCDAEEWKLMIRRDDAHKNWFFWVLFVIVVATLLTE